MAKRSSIKHELEIITTLGSGTNFNGTLKFDSSLMIRGNFEGDIDATGVLYIDEGATVKAGKIRAMSIFVAGTLSGNLEAADKVEFKSNAQVRGNVRTSRLRIADGVLFEGRCEMIQNKDSVDLANNSASIEV